MTGFELKTIEEANEMILQVGMLLKHYDADNLNQMITQFSLSQSASVIFDAIAMENSPYPGGREKFWQQVRFKKEFLERLEPLVRFLNEEEAKVREELEEGKN